MVEHVAGIETGVEENTPMLDLCRKNQVCKRIEENVESGGINGPISRRLCYS